MDIKLQIILTTAQAVVMFNQGIINNTYTHAPLPQPTHN